MEVVYSRMVSMDSNEMLFLYQPLYLALPSPPPSPHSPLVEFCESDCLSEANVVCKVDDHTAPLVSMTSGWTARSRRLYKVSLKIYCS